MGQQRQVPHSLEAVHTGYLPPSYPQSYSYSVAALHLKEIADSDPSLEINLDPNSRTLK